VGWTSSVVRLEGSSNRVSSIQFGWLIVSLVVWLDNWLVGRLVGLLVGWLVGCLFTATNTFAGEWKIR
jgi:hypothetical protein